MTADSRRTRTLVAGLLSDPDYPAELVRYLSTELPELLRERVDETVRWDVRTGTDPITANVRSNNEILDAAEDQRKREGWDFAVYLTDLPMHTGRRPILADVSSARRVAVLSLPCLGGLRLYRRTRESVLRLFTELAGTASTSQLHVGWYQPRAGRRLVELLHPVQRLRPEDSDVDERFAASAVRGRVHLLAGMVRSNQPWRLVFGMASTMAAVLATSAFFLVSTTPWQLADAMGTARLSIAMLAVVGIMVGWIIAYHHIWERTRPRGDRGEAWLYNSATVVTLSFGVLTMYVAVFLANLLAAGFAIDERLLASTVGHPVDHTDYLVLAWLATSAATIAGALGSGLESENTVRQAAYGYRERQRLAERDSA